MTLSTLGHLTNSKEGVALLRDLLLRGETLGVELAETNDLRNVSGLGTVGSFTVLLGVVAK